MGQDQQGSWSGAGMAACGLETGTPKSFACMVTADTLLSLSRAPGPVGRGWRLQLGLVRASKTYSCSLAPYRHMLFLALPLTSR